MHRSLTTVLILSLAVSLVACDLSTPVPPTATPPPSPTSTETPTAIPTASPTQVATATPTATATATPRPSATVPAGQLPMKWPAAPLSAEQLASVRACDFARLYQDRYPTGMSADAVLAAFQPQDDCDLTVQAAALAWRLTPEKPVPDAVRKSWTALFLRNPGFALSSGVFYTPAFGGQPVVEPPPLSRQPISAISITYRWGGLGDKVDYSVTISQADSAPKVLIVPGAGVTTTNLSPNVSRDMVQTLGPALADLLPARTQFTAAACADNYPDWTATLTFKDGSRLDLKTNSSNYLFLGGPWQTTIAGQNYVQLTDRFARAVATLTYSMGLPLGEPHGMACRSVDFVDLAYPAAAPTTSRTPGPVSTPPTPAAPSEPPKTGTPVADLLPIPTGKPVSSWNGVPIMPQAIAGNEDKGAYTFAVKATRQQIHAYYAAEMPKAGWTTFATGTNADGPAMLMYKKDGKTASLLIVVQGELTLVMMVYF